MKTWGWMLSLVGGTLGIFIGWAERLPSLQLKLTLPHGTWPGWDITWAFSAVALFAVILMWTGWHRIGAILVLAASIGGLFGADQLWTTAAVVLFVGAMLNFFAPAKA